ncbi:nickel pincer cofactor biosynthesis protein LarB [Gracilibacillus thailandensis]|uniref:Nickel pincer cofactor biosynthesis protein LarB n=1 Tax=Gracilibacillus thailandensis TaxID=563735 RepID=A0A6N7R0Q6_9BACI|nr:nickel pincer cofactor biosynthesis protein LarB [Gracilibacillus thailandensis]MRI65809.1 nickel pincer cofactor biosynthesis protein LarB [Gracilibacillus thailandensis]
MLEEILRKVADGELSPDKAKEKLATFENLGFAKVDHHRKKRQGFPEVIFGEGKEPSHIIDISRAMMVKKENILITRVTYEKAQVIMEQLPDFQYDHTSRTLFMQNSLDSGHYKGYIAIVCAGTSDLPVAEEAAKTAEAFGVEVRRFYDVGVAGIHRLMAHIDEIREATVSVVVAGMEGALPSVVGGLVSHPIIAVPTSVGYGANFQGLSALLTMLNSCASGISVVNIDNGFGGAYNAVMIHRIANQS